MTSTALRALVTILLLTTAISVSGQILLQDNFDAGKDPAWVHVDGDSTVVDGELVFTGASNNNYRNDFAEQDVEVNVDAARSDRPAGIIMRWNGTTDFLRAYYTPYLGDGGRIWFGGEEFSNGDSRMYNAVDTPGLSGPLHLWVRVSGWDAMFMITDGVRTYGTVRKIVFLEPAPGYFGLCGGRDQRMDNFVISTPAPGLASLSGKVTDASTGLPIAGAIVEMGGTSFSTTTASDGSYTFTDLPEGVWYNLIVRKLGYFSEGLMVLVMPGTNTEDVELDPFTGIDWARAASASASTTKSGTSASNVNDGNAGTGWLPNVDFPTGEWVQLAWEQQVEIAGVLIDSSGPTKDYNLEYSLDGTSWSLIKQVTSAESDHTHWIEIVDETSGMPTPVTMKYLRVYINSGFIADVGTIWGIECYKAKGSVAGYVKDQNGAGVMGATVYVRSDPSRLPMKGTTGAGGYYSIAVPSGEPLTVSSASSDSLAVSSKAVSVAAGSATAVPDLTVRRLGAVQRFADNFDDIADNANDPRWVEELKDWKVLTKRYTVVGWGLHYATVAGQDLAHCVIDVDIIPQASTNNGIVARYKDKDNNLAAVLESDGDFYVDEKYVGKPVLPVPVQPRLAEIDTVLDSGLVHMRLVVVGYYVQAFVSDEWNTYWTPVATLEHFAGSGDLGHGKVGLMCDVLQYGARADFDNFVVYEGTPPAPPAPVRPSEAKEGGAGSICRVQGIVTGVFHGYRKFAVEAEDRSSGIMVDPVRPGDLQMDEEVIVEGVLREDGSLAMAGDASRTGRTVELGPLGVNNRDLLGEGLTNKDLLVSTWGQVLDAPVTESTDGTTRIHITDEPAVAGGPTVTIPAVGWTKIFEDNFDSGKKPEWVDVFLPTRVEDGKLTYDPGSPHLGVQTVVRGLNKANCRVSVDGWSDREMILLYRHNVLPASYSGATSLCFLYFPFDVGQGGPTSLGWGNASEAERWQNAYDKHPNFTLAPPIPVRMVTYFENTAYYFSLTDGTTTVYQYGDIAREVAKGTVAATGDVGVAAAGYTAPQMYDNFLVEIRASPRDVPADSVQVIIPSSVIPPNLQVGDYVKVVGIASEGLAEGDIRAVTVRQSDDLIKIAQ